MKLKLGILLFLAILLIGGGLFLANSDLGVVALRMNGGAPMFPVVLLSALVDSLNPCAFSVLLLTIGFLFSLGKMERTVLKAGFFYIFGIFITYVLIGMGVLRALMLFNVPHGLTKIGAGLLVLVGIIDLLGEWFPNFPIRLGIPKSAHTKLAGLIERASGPIALVLGIAVGLYEFPCTGGPYLFVLSLLHDSGKQMLGFLYLLFYNLVFVLPLIVVLLIASDMKLFEKVRTWKKDSHSNLRFLTGAVMIAIGVLMFIFYG